jgi:putative ABC transport system permease protein
MKTVGARAGQIAALYAALVAALGVFSSLVAWPAGAAAAGGLSQAVAGLLNFDLSSTAIPGWVFWVEAGAGVLVPLLVAALPIRRASRITVREAIDQHGASADTLRPAFSMLPPPLRNALRRPIRLALTLGLLAAGGAMFMTALNVRDGWKRMVDRFYQGRHYDLEVRLAANQPLALAERLRRIPGVLQVEAWGYSPAAFAGSGSVEVVATYPDRGHGSFSVLAPPLQTRLVSFPLLAGRWLQPGDRDALVLNHGASTLARAKVGDEVVLSLEGKRPSCKSGERAAPCRWRVVGIVEEVGNPPVAYLTDQAFAEATGTSGTARMLRIATGVGSDAERGEILRTVERTLDDLGAGIERTTPLSEHGEAVGGHVLILIRTLMAMAIVMAIVGMLGLGSTMGIGVIERSREIAVMRTVGATPGHVTRLVVAEALFIGALSWICALALSVPVTLAVDGVVGGLGFLAPLPLVLSASAALGWLGLVLAGSFASTLLPARRASRVTVREALAQL